MTKVFSKLSRTFAPAMDFCQPSNEGKIVVKGTGKIGFTHSVALVCPLLH